MCPPKRGHFTYGGDDPEDPSGVLRYVRIEFAGGRSNSDAVPNAFGFHGVGSRTGIDHIQAHQSGDDRIEFVVGTVDCTYCVSSGSKDDSLVWAFGWQGSAQYVFIHQDADGSNGIEADNDYEGFDRSPRSHPTLYNVTMIGASAQDPEATSGDGMRIRTGSAITARNVLITGFGGIALNVRDNSPGFFMDRTSSIKNAILHANGDKTGDAQITSEGGGIIAHVGYMDAIPLLVNIRYGANPDPRPQLGSPTRKIGAGAVPPSVGMLNTSAQYIGAFYAENWLEEWTFFGDETDYRVP